MKRERMRRLALFRNPQRGPRRGQGSGCSNLTAGPQLSQVLKQEGTKAEGQSAGGCEWCIMVSDLGLLSYAVNVSAGGGQTPAGSKGGVSTPVCFSHCLPAVSNFQLVHDFFFFGAKVSGFR